MNDVRYALRTLARSPGLSLAAVLTLGLGIGANSAMFRVVDRLFFRPPPHVVDPDRVVRVSVTRTDPRWGAITGGIGTYPDYVAFRARMRGFLTVAASMGASFNLGVGEHARRVTAELVSASFFPVLGVRAERGRFFTEEEDRVGRPAYVAVVSHAFWRGEMEQSQARSEEHTSELQSPYDLVCRLLLEKKKIKIRRAIADDFTSKTLDFIVHNVQPFVVDNAT